MSNPFSTIVVDVKKFFANTGSDVEKLAASFWKIFKKAPTALQTVDNFVTEAGGVVITAVSLADPLVEPEAAAALATIETGLALRMFRLCSQGSPSRILCLPRRSTAS